MKYAQPPFGLGETYQGTDSSGNLINTKQLGKVYDHPAHNLSSTAVRSAKSRRTGHVVRAIILRNESGVTLYGKRLARLTQTAGYSLVESVDGYSASLRQPLVVWIDEFLVTDGVADDDLFWGVISGPITVLTPTVPADFIETITVGAQLIAATASTTQSTLSGRPCNITIGNDTESHETSRWTVGTALSTVVSASTDSDLLINACITLP